MTFYRTDKETLAGEGWNCQVADASPMEGDKRWCVIIWRASVIVMLLGLVVGWGEPVHADSSSARYFSQTGFAIDNDVIWNYFNRTGGINAFGYPISRTFLFEGFTVQFFQRRIVQVGPNGPSLLNILDPGLMPYNSFNNALMPSFD